MVRGLHQKHICPWAFQLHRALIFFFHPFFSLSSLDVILSVESICKTKNINSYHLLIIFYEPHTILSVLVISIPPLGIRKQMTLYLMYHKYCQYHQPYSVRVFQHELIIQVTVARWLDYLFPINSQCLSILWFLVSHIKGFYWGFGVETRAGKHYHCVFWGP